MKTKYIQLIVLFLLISSASNAAQKTWTGNSNTDWNTGTNWSPSGVPTSTDTVTIVSTTNSPLLAANTTVNRLSITSGSLNLAGYNLTVNQRISATGGSVTNGMLIVRGTLATLDGTAFSCKLDVISNQLKLDGCVFNDTCYFEHNGSSASGNGQGGNNFNSFVTIKNSGNISLQLGVAAVDTFNADVKFFNTGTVGITVSYNFDSYINGNVILENTGSGQITFGRQAGTSITTLASGKTFSIGTNGFSAGSLNLSRFIQTGNQSHTLSFSGTSAVVNLLASTFNGPMVISAPSVLLKSNTFNDDLEISKTASSSVLCEGGNTFNGDLTINNPISGATIRMSTQSGDIYNGNVTLNSANGFIQLCYSDTSEFKGNIDIDHIRAAFNVGSGFMMLSGTSNQDLNGSVSYAIGKLLVNKNGGYVTLNQPAIVDSALIFYNGLVYSDSVNCMTFKSPSTTSGASDSSFIDGFVKKIGNSAFTFPIGDSNRYLPLKISAPSSSSDAFLCQGIANKQNISNSLDSTLMLSDTCTYWKLYRTAGSSNITVSLYDDNSNCLIGSQVDNRVSEWNGTKWTNKGNSSISSNFILASSSSTSYSAFQLSNIRKGHTCANSISLVPDTLISNEIRYFTDSIQYYSFASLDDTSIVRLSIAGVSNIASITKIYLYSGTCGSLTLLDSATFGPGDSTLRIRVIGSVSTAYTLAIYGNLRTSLGTQKNNGSFNLDVLREDDDQPPVVLCFDENGCGLGRNMSFGQTFLTLDPNDERPMQPGHVDHNICTWLTANSTPQVQNTPPAVPGSSEFNYAKLFSFDRAEAMYQAIPFAVNTPYVLRFWTRIDPTVQNLVYDPYTVDTDVDALTVYACTDGVTNQYFTANTNFPANWGSCQTIGQITNISNTGWNQTEICFTTSSTNTYDFLYFIPTQAADHLSVIDIDNIELFRVRASAGIDRTICVGASTQLGVISDMCAASGETYSWFPSTGLSSTTDANPIFTPTVEGTYTFTLTVTNEGCTHTDNITVTVGTVDFAITGVNAICAGSPTTLLANTSKGTAPFAYLWSNSSTTSSITVTTAGTYTVTVSDAIGCSKTLSTTVVSSSNPLPATINGSNTSCSGDGTYAISSPTIGFTYAWSNASPASWPASAFALNTATITPGTGNSVFVDFPSTAGSNSSYMLQVVTTNTVGCTSTMTFPINWCCSGSSTNSWINTTSTITGSTFGSTSAVIRGTYTVNTNVSWTDMEIIMEPGAEIIVTPGNTLNILRSRVAPCEAFWKSITVNNAMVNIWDSQIEGGQYAVDVANNGGYDIRETKLMDNYVSLRVTGPVVSRTRRFIQNYVTISSLYNIYADYPGQLPSTCTANDIPFRGILLDRTRNITLGANNPSQRNEIDSVEIGVESINSNPSIFYIDFNDIMDNPCITGNALTGIGILSRNTNLRTTLVSECRFNNCVTGINSTRGQLVADDNGMLNVTNGIFITNTPSYLSGLKSALRRNEIDAVQRGIGGNNTLSAPYHIEISGNKFYETNPPTGNASGGIVWSDFPTTLGTQLDIHENELYLTDYRWGIRVTGSTGFRVVSNLIEYTPTGMFGTIHQGINSTTNSDFDISVNSITDFTGLTIDGLHINNSLITSPVTNNNVSCNYIQNGDRDIRFIGTTPNMDLIANNMDIGNRGLSAEGGANLTLIDAFNGWCGAFTWEAIAIGTSAINIDQFSTNTPLGCHTIPAPTFGVTFLGTGNTTIGTSCPVLPTFTEVTDWDRMAASPEAWDTLEAGIVWQFRRVLAEKFATNPELIVSDNLIEEFYANYSELDEVILANISKEFRDIDAQQSSIYDIIKTKTDTIEYMDSLIQINDSLLYTGLSSIDSTRIESENLDYFNKIDSIITVVDSLEEILIQGIQSSVEDLQLTVEAFEPATTIGEVEKDVWRLILEYGLYSENTVSGTDSTLIQEYSGLCLNEYGPAVTYIKTLYEKIYGEVYDGGSGCDEMWRMSLQQSSSELIESFEVNPNPTKNFVKISSQYNTGAIKVYDLAGKLLIEKELESREQLLDLSELQSGIYLLNLIGESFNQTKKIVVSK